MSLNLRLFVSCMCVTRKISFQLQLELLWIWMSIICTVEWPLHCTTLLWRQSRAVSLTHCYPLPFGTATLMQMIFLCISCTYSLHFHTRQCPVVPLEMLVEVVMLLVMLVRGRCIDSQMIINLQKNLSSISKCTCLLKNCVFCNSEVK